MPYCQKKEKEKVQHVPLLFTIVLPWQESAGHLKYPCCVEHHYGLCYPYQSAEKLTEVFLFIYFCF